MTGNSRLNIYAKSVVITYPEKLRNVPSFQQQYGTVYGKKINDVRICQQQYGIRKKINDVPICQQQYGIRKKINDVPICQQQFGIRKKTPLTMFVSVSSNTVYGKKH